MAITRINWKKDEYSRTVVCPRCGGAGGWQGWPGFTCYLCAGSGKRTYNREAKERRALCALCNSRHKPSEEHWNGLYMESCPSCDAGHSRPQCPRCGSDHPQQHGKLRLAGLQAV